MGSFVLIFLDVYFNYDTNSAAALFCNM